MLDGDARRGARRPPTRSTSAARCSRASRSSSCRCARRPASCPTSTRSPRRPGRASAILWLNYPNNPTAATAPLALLRARRGARARARLRARLRRGVLRDLLRRRPPVSALQLADLRGVAVFNTLSKRSSMPGYRSGFVAGDPELIALLKRYRPNVGVAPQAFVQRAAVAAWGDEAHVEEVRARYRAKRDVLAARARGARPAQRRRRRDVLPLARRRARTPTRSPTACSTAGSCSRPARSSARRAPGYLRLALVPTLGRVRARGGAARRAAASARRPSRRAAPPFAQEGRAPRGESAVADLQALGEPQRLELAHVGLERQPLAAQRGGEVRRRAVPGAPRSRAASPPSRRRGGSRGPAAPAAPRSPRGRPRAARRRRAARSAGPGPRRGTRSGRSPPRRAARRGRAARSGEAGAARVGVRDRLGAIAVDALRSPAGPRRVCSVPPAPDGRPAPAAEREGDLPRRRSRPRSAAGRASAGRSTSHAPLLVRVQRGVQAGPAPAALQRLDRAGLRVAAEQHAVGAAQLGAP